MNNSFEKYDKENPEIWNAFKQIALRAKHEKGFKIIGSKQICEVIRWETKAKGNDGYKVNNNYTADYARKMIALFPEFDGFFELRTRKNNRI